MEKTFKSREATVNSALSTLDFEKKVFIFFDTIISDRDRNIVSYKGVSFVRKSNNECYFFGKNMRYGYVIEEAENYINVFILSRRMKYRK